MVKSPFSKSDGTGSKKSSTSLGRISFFNLPGRITKRAHLEEGTRDTLAESTQKNDTNLHLPQPPIYSKKKQSESEARDTPDPQAAVTATTDDSPLRPRGSRGFELQALDAPASATQVHEDIAGLESNPVFEDNELSLTLSYYPDLAGFMDLPKASREVIYKSLFVTGHIIAVCDCNVCQGLKQPALTCVNREIRADALPFFLGQNRFRIEAHHSAADGVSKWISSMSPQTRSLVKHVELGTYAFQNAVTVMEIYGFKWQKEELDVAKGPWLGQLGTKLVWLTFKGPLSKEDTAQDATKEADEMSIASSVAEIGTAQVQVIVPVRPAPRLNRSIPTIIDGSWHIATPSKSPDAVYETSPVKDGTPVVVPKSPSPVATTPSVVRESCFVSAPEPPETPTKDPSASSSGGKRLGWVE